MTRGPTIVRVTPAGGSGSGIKCCCCRCCECLNLGYLTSQHGIIKLAEAMLGGLCQSLLIQYGMSAAGTLGSAFHSFLTTASSCLLTTALLISCYVLSSKTHQLIRQSIFECLFNAVACFLYLSASSYMGVAVNIYLYPQYVLTTMYAAYPAMTAVYVTVTQENRTDVAKFLPRWSYPESLTSNSVIFCLSPKEEISQSFTYTQIEKIKSLTSIKA